MFANHKHNPHLLVIHRYLSLSCLVTILIANIVSAVALCLHLPLNKEFHGSIDGVKRKTEVWAVVLKILLTVLLPSV